MMSEHAISNAKGWLESIVEMVEALEYDGSEDQDIDRHDDALQTVHESVLSVQVRDGWYDLCCEPRHSEPEEFEILLTAGGPALRIYGGLGLHGEPVDIQLQWQDWGTPWTRYSMVLADQHEPLETFTRQFYFGE